MADTDQTVVPAKPDEHDSLKYHLLGPSLTKAGQGSVDQQKVSALPSIRRWTVDLGY